MERNFFRRIEIFFPIDDPVLKRRIFEESFENYLKDNTQAWKLKKDGTYKLVERKGSSYSAQEKMLKKFE
jgi:polyphosphate kinase